MRLTQGNPKTELLNIPSGSVALIITAGDISTMWPEIDRVLKPKAVVVTYGNAELHDRHRDTKPDWYKYRYVADTLKFFDSHHTTSAIFRNTPDSPKGTFNYQDYQYGVKPDHDYETHLVRTYSNEGDLVLDPFATFATLDAAILNNRDYIGIQSDPMLFELMESELEFI